MEEIGRVVSGDELASLAPVRQRRNEIFGRGQLNIHVEHFLGSGYARERAGRLRIQLEVDVDREVAPADDHSRGPTCQAHAPAPRVRTEKLHEIMHLVTVARFAGHYSSVSRDRARPATTARSMGGRAAWRLELLLGAASLNWARSRPAWRTKLRKLLEASVTAKRDSAIVAELYDAATQPKR